MKGSAFLPVLVAGLTPLAVLVLIVTATALGPIAWKPPLLWMDTFGTHTNLNSATVIATDATGLYVQAYVNNSGLRQPSGSLVLSKYTLDGSSIWTRTIGNTNTTFFKGMYVASDGIYLAGGNLTSGIVQKYDLSGNPVWTRQFGSGEISGISFAFPGVYVANRFGTSVREYDAVGNVVWTSWLTNDSSANVAGLYATSSGVYAVGSVASSLPSSTKIGDYDAFLVKYDLNGSLGWTRQFGTPQFEADAYSVSGDSTGVYVSGRSMSALFGFLRKYDFNGNLVWADQIDSPDGSGVGNSAVAVDSSSVYVSLSTNREFIMKYDLNGGRLWSFQMPSSGEDYALGRAYRLATGMGRLYVAGSLPDASAGLVGEVATSPSLVFFGVNPPFSFVLVGAFVGGAVISLLFFRRLRRRRLRLRPSRVGPLDRSLPARD